MNLVEITFDDYRRPESWVLTKGLFPAATEEKIQNLRPRKDGELPDIELRFAYPVNISAPRKRGAIALVLATAEGEISERMHSVDSPSWRETESILMVPSNWSIDLMHAKGGVPDDRMIRIPHGVDPAQFHPGGGKRSAECVELYRKLDVNPSDFVYLHIGAASKNKNLPILLDSFYKIHQQYSNTVLLLKTHSALYSEMTQEAVAYAQKYNWGSELVW
jgi:hypothetical protein